MYWDVYQPRSPREMVLSLLSLGTKWMSKSHDYCTSSVPITSNKTEAGWNNTNLTHVCGFFTSTSKRKFCTVQHPRVYCDFAAVGFSTVSSLSLWQYGSVADNRLSIRHEIKIEWSIAQEITSELSDSCLESKVEARGANRSLAKHPLSLHIYQQATYLMRHDPMPTNRGSLRLSIEINLIP